MSTISFQGYNEKPVKPNLHFIAYIHISTMILT